MKLNGTSHNGILKLLQAYQDDMEIHVVFNKIGTIRDIFINEIKKNTLHRGVGEFLQ